MEEPEDPQWAIDFAVAKSIRYHAYRRAFWQALDRWTKILTIVTGTGVLISYLKDAPTISGILAAAVALMSSLDLVLGFSSNERQHDDLYRAFSLLAQDIADCDQPSRETIAKWRRRRLEIEMNEPTAMDWLERRCCAEEARARGAKVDALWMLPPWQIRLSQFAMWGSAK